MTRAARWRFGWAMVLVFPTWAAVAQEPVPKVGGPSVEATVAKALKSQTDLIARREHCAVDPEHLRAIGREVGHQVRIEREGGLSTLFTVTETSDESSAGLVRMGKMGRAKFGSDAGALDEFSARVYANGPHPTLSEEAAKQLGECVERADDDGAATGLLVLAPHGGGIEINTDKQAERLAAALTKPGKAPVTSWRFKGYSLPGGPSAAARWHITSTETSEVSFPLLGKIAERKFDYAVSFHGMGREGVLIGGAASDDLKRALQAEIQRALEGTDLPVVLALPGDRIGGFSPRNIVNRYCEGGGVQLEQSPRVRREHWQAVADAVARVYESRL